MCNYTVDAKQNSRSRRHVQGSLQGVIHLGLYLFPPASMRLASPLSTLCYACGVDSSLVFHMVAEAGTLAQHVKQLTGKTITDGALAQRRALLPPAVFEADDGGRAQAQGRPGTTSRSVLSGTAAVWRGWQLCFRSPTPLKSKSKCAKRAVGAGGRLSRKSALSVMVELGLHNPLAAALGANGESEMVLAKRVLAAQPEKSLLHQRPLLRGARIVGRLAGGGERHFLVRVKKNLKRRLLEVYPDGSALVEIRSDQGTRLVREILGRVQRGGRGLSRRCDCGPVCWTGAGIRRPSCWRCMPGAGSKSSFTRS